jgi:hypothetical protein
MESAAIASTSTAVYGAYPILPSSPLLSYLELDRMATRPPRAHGMTAFKIPAERTMVAGIALALAGVLLIIATRWGHFGGS